jgi:osmotically-inducible protein OsmY
MYPFPEVPDDWNDPDVPGDEPDPADECRAISVDELIAEIIAASVLSNPRIRGRYLHIQVQNRVAILTGEVTTADARTVLRSLAWATPGIRDVCNRVKVAPSR